MPRGGNKKARSNKKKKGRNAAPADQAPATAAASSDEAAAGAENLKREEWPDFAAMSERFGHRRERKDPGTTFESVYDRYQAATRRFRESLRTKVPEDVFGAGTTSDLVKCCAHIADTNRAHAAPRQPWKIVVEKDIMDDLTLSIRIWNRVTSYRCGGGTTVDQKHSTFVLALKYCYRVLHPYAKMAVPRRRRPKPALNENDDENFKDRFKRLSVGDEKHKRAPREGASEDDFEEELLTKPVERPKDEDIDKMALDVVHADDRFRAILFLSSLDELMNHNARQFGKLKSAWHRTWLERNPPLGIIEQLMGTAVSANMTIEHVQAIEQRLFDDYPHMNTVYRCLAVLIMPQAVGGLTRVVMERSPLSEEFFERDAVQFLGDCLECSFRSKTDPLNMSDSIVSDFATRWKIDRSIADKKLKEVAKVAHLEEPLSQDLEQVNMMKRSGPIYQQWLPDASFIGKSRSIIKTVRLLQVLSSAMNEGVSLQVAPGFYGKEWDENRNRTQRKISGDLDQFLMSDVMPILIEICRDGLLSSDLPREGELMPLFVQLKRFAKDPNHTVTWSLAFAVHSMLTAVFEIQGAGNIQNLAAAAKQCYEKYFTQTEWAIQEIPELGHGEYWEQNLRSIDKLQFLVTPPQWAPNQKAMRALWNPLCGGTFLLYLTYFGNIDCGLAMVDSFGQLRVALHLFNALIEVGAFKNGDMQLLDWMQQAFSTCQAVWEGPVPKKGQFLYRWLIAHGVSVQDAKRKCVQTRNEFANPSGAPGILPPPTMENPASGMTPIKQEDLSTSFRHICLRDFSGEVEEDKPQTGRQRRIRKESDAYRHALRVNDTVDAMEVDKRLLASNMWSLGEVLNKFFVQLFDVLELKPVVRELIAHQLPDEYRSSEKLTKPWQVEAEKLKRAAMLTVFSEKVLGGLDFLSKPADDRVVGFAYAYMKLFFDQMQPDQVMYFLPVYYWSDSEEEEDSSSDS